MFKNLFNKLIFKKVKSKKCNFCDSKEFEGNPFITGDNCFICCNCICTAHKIFFGDLEYDEDCQSGDSVDKYVEIDFLDAIRNK